MNWAEELNNIMPTEMTSTELADHFGVSITKMRNLLQHYGFIPDVDYKRITSWKWKNATPWHEVDWTQRNKDIAAEYGRDVSYVSHMRRKHAPDHLKRRKKLTAKQT